MQQTTQSTYDILSSLVSTGPYTTHRRSTQHAIRCASPRQTIGSIARASHGWACTRHHMLRRCCDSRHDKCITSHTALRNRAVGTAAITAHRPHKLTEGVQHHRRRLPTPPRSTADALRSMRAFRPAPLSGGLVSAGVLPLASLACIGEDVPPLGGVDGLSVVYGVSGWKRRSSSSRSCEQRMHPPCQYHVHHMRMHAYAHVWPDPHSPSCTLACAPRAGRDRSRSRKKSQTAARAAQS